MSLEIIEEQLPPLPKLNDTREATYTQDPELARLMAEKEAPLRNNAARKRAMSKRLAREGFTAKAQDYEARAQELVSSAMDRAGTLETNFNRSLKQ